jgi:protein-tyrosine phosphatase
MSPARVLAALAGASRIVFVCKGNICRSAYAEAAALALGIDSISFGLETRSGLPADRSAAEAAAMLGVDLRRHCTRVWNPANLRAGDAVAVMEPWQARRARESLPADFCVTLLGALASGSPRVVADPYGKSMDHFLKCFGVIDAALETIASERLRRREGGMR